MGDDVMLKNKYMKDLQTMILYEHEGSLWVRSEEEFDDGRFES